MVTDGWVTICSRATWPDFFNRVSCTSPMRRLSPGRRSVWRRVVEGGMSQGMARKGLVRVRQSLAQLRVRRESVYSPASPQLYRGHLIVPLCEKKKGGKAPPLVVSR